MERLQDKVDGVLKEWPGASYEKSRDSDEIAFALVAEAVRQDQTHNLLYEALKPYVRYRLTQLDIEKLARREPTVEYPE